MNPLPLDTFGWRSARASGKGKKWPMCLCQRVPLEASRSRLAGATGTFAWAFPERKGGDGPGPRRWDACCLSGCQTATLRNAASRFLRRLSREEKRERERESHHQGTVWLQSIQGQPRDIRLSLDPFWAGAVQDNPSISVEPPQTVMEYSVELVPCRPGFRVANLWDEVPWNCKPPQMPPAGFGPSEPKGKDEALGEITARPPARSSQPGSGHVVIIATALQPFHSGAPFRVPLLTRSNGSGRRERRLPPNGPS
ncbi:hypothetical protein CISG_02869 [Coccidioides immitis RMSCC 3703]|uniref:Uncharacterized protein n=2 Tax=Coccidioides immitis TaxID=5501 RepID=A0A0J8RD75_COCIT|nr:hypothetical protein CIRG_00195 [Coccidioides immitis RMSCC 2394]KMU81853.1 hypothetical protein CISG_02869 [Coccidioides immitis RMSCC 3703]